MMIIKKKIKNDLDTLKFVIFNLNNKINSFHGIYIS